MSHSKDCRAVQLGEYMVSHKTTVRKTAEKFCVSKSTVHKDIRTQLPQLDPELYEQVEKLLELNKQERHIRGGMATKLKYERRREAMKKDQS